jgi:hypothetical protein
MLSNSAIMILVMAAIVVTVLIGIKFDNNIGLIGIGFAFLIGSWLGPATIYEVIGYWPVNIMFILLVTSVFFGYASNNGTLSALADRIVYATKGIPWFTPISVFITAFIISGIGVGVWGIVFVAPIGFAIAKKAKFDPILVPIATNVGALATGGLPWAAGGPTNIGLIQNAGWADPQEATRLAYQFGFASIPCCVVAFIICYFLCRGFKAQPVTMDRPEPFTKKQKQTLAILLIVLVANMLPLILNLIFANTVTAYLASHINIQVCSVFGAIACMMLKLGDEKEILSKNVPWYAMVLICGVSMLMAVAVKAGIADVIGTWLNANFPAWTLPAAFALFGGILSFFCSALSVVYPLMLPMIYGLAQNGTSASTLAMITALIITACYTGMCPFSQNGALMLSSADAETRHGLMYRMIGWSVVLLVISVVYALIGGYGIWG